MVALSSNQTLKAWGAEVKALDTVITLPVISETVFVSIVPSVKITDNWSPVLCDVGKSLVLSTVICVVVAVFILPDLLVPLRTGSWTVIIWFGLIKEPASAVVVKATVSVSLFCVNKCHNPALLACAWLLQPTASIFLTTTPYLDWFAAVSSTVSYSKFLVSLLKYLTLITVSFVLWLAPVYTKPSSVILA